MPVPDFSRPKQINFRKFKIPYWYRIFQASWEYSSYCFPNN